MIVLLYLSQLPPHVCLDQLLYLVSRVFLAEKVRQLGRCSLRSHISTEVDMKLLEVLLLRGVVDSEW